MTLPAANHPCWKRLAGGALSRMKTQHLGTQLLTKRVERGSDSLDAKANDIYAFFAKWERALPKEVQQLTTL